MRRAAYSFVLLGFVVLVIAGFGGVEARGTAYTVLGVATIAATVPLALAAIDRAQRNPGTCSAQVFWRSSSAGSPGPSTAR